MYPWKVAIGCKCFWKFPQLNVYGLIMFKTFAPEHSWRLTFQFPGISVPVPAIYHVKGINKEENGSTFALAKAFSFGWRKRCSMNNIKKTILVLLKQKKKLVKSHLATPALPVLELWIGTRYTMKTCCDPAHRHTRSATLRAPSPGPCPWHKILSWGRITTCLNTWGKPKASWSSAFPFFPVETESPRISFQVNVTT